MNILYLILAVAIAVSIICFVGFSIMWRMIDFDDILPSIGFGVIGCVATLVFVIIYFFAANGESYKSNTFEISALQDNSNVSGVIFLGSGYVNSDQHYFFITETEKGKKMKKAHMDDAFLNEGDYNPHVDIYNYKYKSKFAKWLYGKDKFKDYEFVFFIPENTVTTNFNVDMK